MNVVQNYFKSLKASCERNWQRREMLKLTCSYEIAEVKTLPYVMLRTLSNFFDMWAIYVQAFPIAVLPGGLTTQTSLGSTQWQSHARESDTQSTNAISPSNGDGSPSCALEDGNVKEVITEILHWCKDYDVIFDLQCKLGDAMAEVDELKRELCTLKQSRNCTDNVDTTLKYGNSERMGDSSSIWPSPSSLSGVSNISHPRHPEPHPVQDRGDVLTSKKYTDD